MQEISLSPESPEPAPSRRVLHHHDAYDQARTLGALDQSYQQLSKGVFHGSLELVQSKDVTIFRETLEQSVFQTGRSDPDHLTIAWACELSQPAYWNGRYIGEDAAIAFAPGREFELRSPHHAICVGISLPLAVLNSLDAGKSSSDWARLFSATDCWTVPIGKARSFSGRLSLCLEACTTVSGALQHEVALNDTVDSIIDHIDQLLENNHATGHKLRADSYPRIARRARALMLDRLDEPLTIGDICRTLGCSRRALQYAFESVYDVNPVAYLRNLRLHAARKALLLHHPGTTVHAVAMAYGFSHLSRFARDYASMFGEQPSQSLGKAH